MEIFGHVVASFDENILKMHGRRHFSVHWDSCIINNVLLNSSVFYQMNEFLLVNLEYIGLKRLNDRFHDIKISIFYPILLLFETPLSINIRRMSMSLVDNLTFFLLILRSVLNINKIQGNNASNCSYGILCI